MGETDLAEAGMSGSLADRLADTAFRLAAGLDCDDAPRPAKRVRVTAAVRPAGSAGALRASAGLTVEPLLEIASADRWC